MGNSTSATSPAATVAQSWKDIVKLSNTQLLRWCNHWTIINPSDTIDSGNSAFASLAGSSLWKCDKSHASAATAGLKRLRTLKHPLILSLIDSVENEEGITMVTEKGWPLGQWLESARDTAEYEREIAYGLFTLFSALAFLHNDAKLAHGSLTVDSVIVTRGGQWKLALLETCSPIGSASPPGTPVISSSGDAPSFTQAPERSEYSSLAGISFSEAAALDAYALGVIVADVFGGPIMDASKLKTAATRVPRALRDVVTRMLSTTRKGRLYDLAGVLSSCEYFRNPIISTVQSVDKLALMESHEKQEFFRSLPEVLPMLPSSIAMYCVLPALMKALEFGAAGGVGTSVLGCILDIGAKLPKAEYAREIIPCVIRLFANNDRATRVQLLHHLPSYIDKIGDDVVNANILPSIVNGFADTSPVLREATVKSCLYILPKLAPDNRIMVISKYLRPLQGDTVPSIRVNTVICLGRVAGVIDDPNHRETLLLASFARCLSDSFPPSRAAALRAISHCLTAHSKENNPYWSADCIARKILPTIVSMTLDPSHEVRECIFTAIEACLKVLKAHSAVLAEAEAKAQALAAKEGSADSVAQNQASKKATDAVTSALGWAVSSLASRIIPSGSIDGSETPVIAASAAPRAPAPAPAQKPAVVAVKSAPVASVHSSSTEKNGWGDDGWNMLDNTANNSKSGWNLDEDDTDSVPPVTSSKHTAPKRAMEAKPVAVKETSSAEGWDWDSPEPTPAAPQRPIASSTVVKQESTAPGASTATAKADGGKLVLGKKLKDKVADSGWDEW